MKAIHILAAINVAIWGCLILSGRSLIRGVEEQHVLGFPNPGQITYYLYMPVALVAVAISFWLLARSRMFKGAALGIELLALLAVLPYMLFYTGGI